MQDHDHGNGHGAPHHPARLDRRPGQKEDRYAQLLGEAQTERLGSDPVRGQTPPDKLAEIEARVERLEAAFDELRQLVSGPWPTRSPS